MRGMKGEVVWGGWSGGDSVFRCVPRAGSQIVGIVLSVDPSADVDEGGVSDTCFAWASDQMSSPSHRSARR